MRLPARLSCLLVILSATLGLGAGQRQRGALLRGPASGIWEQPEGGGAFVLGTLDALDGGPALYELRATLAPYPVMCPACVAGSISGTLDDGIGPGPDFLVLGSYVGDIAFDGGVGDFALIVKKPGGTRVGSLRGHFSDPGGQGSPRIGSFVGRYAIRR